MNDFIIRQAELKDAQGIAKVHVETWQCAYRGQIPDSFLNSLSTEKRTNVWEKNLNDPESKAKTFIAKYKGKIIGFGSSGPCRDSDMPGAGELWAIYVDKNSMGKGIGFALQKVCLEYLKELGFNKATLWVLTTNEKTRKWYETKGWKIEGKTRTDPKEGFVLRETRYIIDL